MQDLISRTLGQHRITDKIGEGGMGVVYRAHDEFLRKLPKAHQNGDSTE